MDKRRLSQWILLAVVCLSFSIGESYAQKNDFANLRRYSKENAALPQATKKDKRVIFMGNSITEGWVRTHPDFFKSNGYIGRGISGQTSYQFLLRFREDVINLSPALVVLMPEQMMSLKIHKLIMKIITSETRSIGGIGKSK